MQVFITRPIKSSGFFGNTIINNQPLANGANEFDIFFDMLFSYQQDTITGIYAGGFYRFLSTMILMQILRPM